MAIIVYNKNKEEFNGDNVFYCGRGSYVGNPYTHIKDRKTKALFVVKDREEAINMYNEYYDRMYGSNDNFTNYIDQIYNLYKTGEDVYLGCFCHPQHCHCDIIKEKLQKRLIKEKIKEIKK